MTFKIVVITSAYNSKSTHRKYTVRIEEMKNSLSNYVAYRYVTMEHDEAEPFNFVRLKNDLTWQMLPPEFSPRFEQFDPRSSQLLP